MRVALIIFAVGSILPSFFQIVVKEAGIWEAIGLTVCAAGTGAAVGPLFMRWWAGSPASVVVAGVVTMIISAGITFLLALAASILLAEEPLAALISAPMVFASGALIAPLSMISAPLSLIPWFLGVTLVGYCARRTLREAELQKRPPPTPHGSWQSHSHQ